MAEQAFSFLDLVNRCDNVIIGKPPPPSMPPSAFDDERLIPFHLTPAPDSPKLGLIRPIVLEQLHAENALNQRKNAPEMWHTITPDRVSFCAWLDTHEKRTAAMKVLCERWRDDGIFSDVCGPRKWRAELYPVYADPFGARDHPSDSDGDPTRLNFVFEMERAACALFGIVTYGVHMTIYEQLVDRSLRIWVPSRAKTKQTYPGCLDNTVAGGTPSGMSFFEALVKESSEDASLEDDIVRKHARCAGVISYFIRTSGGWLQPEVEYVYDLMIPPGADPEPFKPRPSDGEVECFELLDQDEVVRRLRAGRFKPNCALVLIDLFMRLGHITPENEPDYLRIQTRLHGDLCYHSW
ncbi:nudix hydrolase 20 [Fistulina hepatica ATCC 64428]|uniref:Nudix hydrolase 20 n=1 Tax=Fistulina hepatica ATCC 64428 TaxID=1128425 RepID=A0A0D7AFC1_9AGAR|nr:nudix hydrolase 20 [Fistulina hepatica ATCC 64428]